MLLDEWHLRWCAPFGPNLVLASCGTWLYLTMVLVENSKPSCKALPKGYLLSIFHPLDCLEKARCTWNLVLIRLAGKVLPVPGEETERTELNSLPGFAETPSTTKCNFLILGFPCSWDLQKTGSQSHYSMLLQSGIAYGKDKVRTTLVHPSLWACRVFPFLWQQHVLLGHWWVHFQV